MRIKNFLFVIIISLAICSCKDKNIPTSTALPGALDPNYKATWASIPDFFAAQHAYAIDMNDGGILWLFGKSHIKDKVGDKVLCTHSTYNSGVVQNGTTYNLINKDGSNYLFKNDTRKFIPICGYRFQDTIFVFCHQEKLSNEIEKGYLYIAKILKSSLLPVAYDSISSNNNIHYGQAVVEDAVLGYAYMYGLKENATLGNQYYLAKVSIDNPLKKWTYYNGSTNTWVTDPNGATSIFNTQSKKMTVRKFWGQYISVLFPSYPNCSNDQTIKSYIAAYPEGPFNGPSLLYKPNKLLNGVQPNILDACMQPSMLDGKNALITYSYNGYGTCFADCDGNGFTNPDYYNTYGFRVNINKINPAW
jgi:hypothetical protein